MASTASSREPPTGLEALAAVTAAVESGSGLPEVVRAVARALDAALAVIDRSGAVLAVAATPGEEAVLHRQGEDVHVLPLRLAAAEVGQMRLRARGRMASPAVLGLVSALVAGEVERVRAPERASEEAAAAFLRDVLAGTVEGHADLVARGHELGIDLAAGGSVVVARAHAHRPADPDWRRRFLAAADRAARATAPGAIAVGSEPGPDDVTVLLADSETGEVARRLAEVLSQELEAGLEGFSFALGRSQPARDPHGFRRAGAEALLAANVGESATSSVLAYEDLGTYRLIFPLFMEQPDEVQRFYAETVAALVAYDEQYETDLVGTLETFLDCDGNFGAAAARMFTHRHTVRYRLGRIRELSGLDASGTDGREKLSLGLKAMRVLGLGTIRGPASERGTGAGRVPQGGVDG